MKRPRKTLQRMCVGCREMKEKKTLIRIVRDPDGNISLDPTGKKSGRGAYVCNNQACFDKAIQTKALAKALECGIPPEVLEHIQSQLEVE